MPRQARLDFPGCLHHVINRGMERRRIFQDPEDYQDFKESLERFAVEDGIRCYAWVLMPNHFHLVVETGKVPLATFMSRLQTSYVGRYNRRHRRCGRLFQNRYKSIVCDKDAYFQQLIAYVHLNPLRGGLVKTLPGLDNYPWSGHRALLGLERSPWQDVDGVMETFGKTGGEARRRYEEFLAERQGVKQDLSGGGLVRSAGGLSLAMGRRGESRTAYDTRILGDGEFVSSVARMTEKIEGRRPWKKSVAEVMRAVAEREGVPWTEVVAPGKTTARGSRAREIMSYLAVAHGGERKSAMAERLNVTPLAVTRLYRAGEQRVGKDAEKLMAEMGMV